MTFGPRNERDYTQKINKKMRVGALAAVLSRKLREGEVMFVDDVSFAAPRAKEAKNVLGAFAGVTGFGKLATKKRNAALIALGERNENTEKSFRNFGHISVGEVRSVNPVDLLRHTYIIITRPDAAIASLTGRIRRSSAEKSVHAEESPAS